MFPEYKTKSSVLVIPKLFLAAVILICFSTVLGVAGYLTMNRPIKISAPALNNDTVIKSESEKYFPENYSSVSGNIFEGDLDNDGTIEAVIKVKKKDKVSEVLLVLKNNNKDYIIQKQIDFGAGETDDEILIKDINNDKIPEIIFTAAVGFGESMPRTMKILEWNGEDYKVILDKTMTLLSGGRPDIQGWTKNFIRDLNDDKTLEVIIPSAGVYQAYCDFSTPGCVSLLKLDVYKWDGGKYIEATNEFLSVYDQEIKLANGFLKDPNIQEDSRDKIEKYLKEIDELKKTANWQTYRNEKYGFEVKYPEDFEGQEPETGDILLEAMKRDSGGSYYFTIKTRLNYKIDRDASIVANSEKIIVGDHPGYKYFYTEGAGKSGVVLIQAGQDELTISFDFIGDGQIANDRKIYFQDFFNQILSTFNFTEPEVSCKEKSGSDQVDCFTSYLSQNPILGDIAKSDDKLKDYFSENLLDLKFTGISRGKFDKFSNENMILVSMYWSAGKANQAHIFILKENLKKNWDVLEQTLDFFIDFVNDPKILVKGEPAFFIGHTNYTGGTCVPVSWNTIIYRLENNKFNSLLSTEYFANGAIYNQKQEEGVNSIYQIETLETDITYKDLDNDGNLEIIKEGTRQMCEGEGACYSNDCTTTLSKNKIYEIYKWNSQKQTFIKE